MAENTKSTEFLTKLAMIADAGQTLINGKMTIIFEVMNPDYSEVINEIEEKPDYNKEQFKIEISGSDFIFILDKQYSQYTGISYYNHSQLIYCIGIFSEWLIYP